MLAYWLSEEENEFRNKADTLLGIIYTLRITDQKTLKIVTGWTDNQIHGALQRIRAMGKDWINSWRPKYRSPYVYTLGKKGIEHIKAIKDDALGYEAQEIAIKGQVAHFMGTNRILSRLLEAGIKVEDWRSARDTMSYLFYELRPKKSPVNPDALLKLGQGNHLLEFDTGSENGGKIEGKIHRYMMLAVMIGKLFPIVWVTTKPSRTEFIAKKASEAANSYLVKMEEEIKKRSLPLVLPKEMPIMYAFTEGEEVPFFAGTSTATPILGTE